MAARRQTYMQPAISRPIKPRTCAVAPYLEGGSLRSFSVPLFVLVMVRPLWPSSVLQISPTILSPRNGASFFRRCISRRPESQPHQH